MLRTPICKARGPSQMHVEEAPFFMPNKLGFIPKRQRSLPWSPDHGGLFIFRGTYTIKIMQEEKVKKLEIRNSLIWALAIPLMVTAYISTVNAAAPSISGHIETTYMYDFSDPVTGTTALRSYDATANSFYINAVHLVIAGELEEGVGYTVELDHGSDSAITAGTADLDIQEAYLTFPVGPLGFTAGKFVTYEGIEVIEGPDNPTISRGYLFGLAEAFTHVGAKAHMGLGEKIDVGIGIVNGRDVDTDNNDGKTAIWRVGFDLGDPLSFGISGSHGPDNARTNTSADQDMTTSLDLTGSLGIVKKLPIAFQVLYAQMDNAKAGSKLGKWSGFGIQPILEITEKFSIGGRVEYFDDMDRSARTMTNVTITPTHKCNDAITVRAELRYDDVNDPVGSKTFIDDQGKGKSTNTTASLGFSYAFGG